MRVEGNKIVLEQRTCYSCQNGKMAGIKLCPTCNGTGKGKRGKIKGCKECLGYKTVPDFVNRVTCVVCNGTNSVPETYYDYMPDDMWKSLTFKVYRKDVPMTTEKSLLGIDCIFSYSDYGRAYKQQIDDEVLEDVKAHGAPQAIHVCKQDGTLCDHVAIYIGPTGYSVEAVYM